MRQFFISMGASIFTLICKCHQKKQLLIWQKQPNTAIDDSLITWEHTYVSFFGTCNRFIVDSGVVFRRFCSVLLYENASLIIHENVFFNNYCSINCLGKIEIGRNTIFGEGVKMYDHNHQYQFHDKILQVERNNYKIGSIKIGNNCWIGSNVTILNNVVIGDNVIIGANCLIYKSVPANTVVKAFSELSSKLL